MPKFELYGTEGCPYTEEMREFLEWRGEEFVEYDVEADPRARARMLAFTKGQRLVPVLIEDDKVTQIGWQGRACVVSGA